MLTKDEITSAAAECLMDGHCWDSMVEAIIPRLPEIDSHGVNALIPELVGTIAFYVGRCPEFTQSAPGTVDWVNIAETLIDCARATLAEFPDEYAA